MRERVDTRTEHSWTEEWHCSNQKMLQSNTKQHLNYSLFYNKCHKKQTSVWKIYLQVISLDCLSLFCLYPSLFYDAFQLLEPGCSTNTLSGNGLDDGRSRFDSRQKQRIFPVASLSRPALGHTQPPVQFVPGVLPPGRKRGRGVMLTTHSYLVPRSRMSRSYIFSPLKSVRVV
jgi:hypothetical protein